MVIWLIKIDEKIGNPTNISDLINYCHNEPWKLLQGNGCRIYDDFIIGCKPYLKKYKSLCLKHGHEQDFRVLTITCNTGYDVVVIFWQLQRAYNASNLYFHILWK